MKQLSSLSKTAFSLTQQSPIPRSLSHAQCSTSNLSPSSSSLLPQKQHLKSLMTSNNKKQSPYHVSHKYSPDDWDTFLTPILTSQPRSTFTTNTTKPTTDRICNRWEEYQGIHDWAGLLNPLDPNLRNEILRYGYFVEAAYRSFNFNPSSSTYASSLFRRKELLPQTGFPNTGYIPTKNLRATSSISLPKWTEKAASWAGVQSSWIGYVAVCQDKKEIARLGRRDVVIAFRGTATCLEWMENLRATLTPFPDDDESSTTNDPPMVESGFLSLYTSRTDTCPSLQDTLRTEIARIMETYKDEELSFTFTGHSLGAALATLAAYDIKKEMNKCEMMTTVVSFGGPRVGNGRFRSLIEKEGGVKILRIVNPDDVITKMPGFVIDEDDDDEVEETKVSGWDWEWPSSWFQKRVEDTKWVYAEVGCELRVNLGSSSSSKRSNDQSSSSSTLLSSSGIMNVPYNLMNMDFAKCHDLKTYLTLVGSSSESNSSSPFREKYAPTSLLHTR